MADVGRPRVLDEGKRREIVALVATGYGLPGAAKYVGCTVKTIRREASRDQEFSQQLREAEMKAKMKPLRAIRYKAHTHWRAAAWLLERTEPERFGKPDHKLLKPVEVDNLLDAVLSKLLLELTDNPLGQAWFLSAAKLAKENVLKKKTVRSGNVDFDRLFARSMDFFADQAEDAEEDQPEPSNYEKTCFPFRP
ncbi:MAG: hypothetical protein SH868_14725 [Bythopirellula sp.]|nr:hypothetical protein [Bythopirellula sp.]